MLIDITQEERNAGIIQLGQRIDYLNEELTSCKDPNRIKELVEFMKPIESLKSKLITAKLKHSMV